MQINQSVLLLLHQKEKTIVDLKLMHTLLTPFLHSLIKRVQAQSLGEILFVINSFIKLYEQMQLHFLPAHHYLCNQVNDNTYVFIQGQIGLEYDERQDKQKKFHYIHIGTIIDSSNMRRIFSLTDSYFIVLSQQNLIHLQVKHEQLLRQKRHFIVKLFMPITLPQKQLLFSIADEMHLLTFEENEIVFDINQEIQALFIVFNGEIQINTKKNVLCKLKEYDMFNEECSTTSYQAIVKSKGASVLKLEKELYQLLPERIKQQIQKQQKKKSLLRQKMLENHILTIQIPLEQQKQFNSIQYKHSTNKSGLSLEKYLSPKKKNYTEFDFESFNIQEQFQHKIIQNHSNRDIKVHKPLQNDVRSKPMHLKTIQIEPNKTFFYQIARNKQFII